MTAPAPPSDRPRAERFTYLGVEVDEAADTLRCRYRLRWADGAELTFVETYRFPPGGTWSPAAHEVARLVHLFAGVSYYKAGIPPVVDLGDTPLRRGDRALLEAFYLDGLGEMAYRNGVSLDGLALEGGTDAGPPAPTDLGRGRPLVPFGGGIDSTVVVDAVTRVHDDVALFVVHRGGDPFPAIERAAEPTGLPILRVQRDLDPQLLRPAEPDRFWNGHVPITGILSAVAVLTAALHGRDLVVMSNEWSSSQGNLEHGGRVVNHQWSKSEAFERLFRAALAEALDPPVEWFSLLRPRSELWVAQRFARLPQFHGVVHSCNRAFHLDADRRQAAWCGRCEKCVFIDLILSPFLDRTALEAIFDGREPLADPSLLPAFRDLIGIGTAKPWECVGDIDECRTAAALAAERADRAGNEVLAALLDDLGPDAVARARADVDRLLAPMGPHWVPDALLDPPSLG